MFIRRTIRKAVPHDLQFFAVLLNNDPADVGGWGFDLVWQLLAISFAASDRPFLFLLGDCGSFCQLMHVALGEDITAAGKLRVLVADQGDLGPFCVSLRIFGAVNETGQVP